MEYDIERIGKLIKDIEKYFAELEKYNIKKTSDLEDTKTYHASSMVVFAILNRIIDLGNEILLAEKIGAPNTYQDIMPLLAKANIINKQQAEDLNKLVRKRNVLAHFYEEINEKDLYETIKDLRTIPQFLKTVKKRLSTK